MSEIQRFNNLGRPCLNGCFVGSSDYGDAQSELAALREELASRNEVIAMKAWEVLEAQTAVTGWASKCKAAEQRNAELAACLQKCAADLSGIGSFLKSFHEENESQWCGYLDDALGAARYRHSEVITTLKPTESGASE